MAKVNFGTIASDARGKINGIVYSKNKFGSYTRRKVTPANPNTPAQTAVRTQFGVFAKNWSNLLTPAQRAAWTAFAATYPRTDVFGNSIVLTGSNYYIALNAVLTTTGSAPITDPPPNNVIAPVNFDPASLASAAGVITFNQTTNAATNVRFYIFGQKPLPAGRAPTKSQFRFLEIAGQVAGALPHPIDISATYTAKFGIPQAGQNVSVLVASVDDTTGITTVGTIAQALAT